MESYASQQDIVDRYGEDILSVAADRDGDGQPDNAVVTQALEDASHEIDSYVGARYDLPLPSKPALLQRICIDIALYRMSSEADVATEERRTRYQDAVKLLRGIAKGEMTLGLPNPEPPTVHAVRTQGTQRLFNRDTMRGLRI